MGLSWPTCRLLLNAVHRSKTGFCCLSNNSLPQKKLRVLSKVHQGKALKSIIDFATNQESPAKRPFQPKAPNSPKPPWYQTRSPGYFPPSCQKPDLRERDRRKFDEKSKPLDALGTLEEFTVGLSPQVKKKMLLVFAGDHGVAEEGVSVCPAEGNAQIMPNCLDQGAAVKVFCNT